MTWFNDPTDYDDVPHSPEVCDMGAPSGPRPITRALDILDGALWLEFSKAYQLPAPDYRELRKILKTIDARETKPDPSLRKRKPAKRPAKKAAKSKRR